MVKTFNSIFPKVCKNGFRTFVPGTLDMFNRKNTLAVITDWLTLSRQKIRVSHSTVTDS